MPDTAYLNAMQLHERPVGGQMQFAQFECPRSHLTSTIHNDFHPPRRRDVRHDNTITPFPRYVHITVRRRHDAPGPLQIQRERFQPRPAPTGFNRFEPQHTA